MDQEHNQPQEKSRFSLQWVVILVLAVLLVIFTLQNQDKVSLKLLFWTISDIPVALLIVICLLLGYLIPYFSFVPRIWKLKNELRQARFENEELEATAGEESVKRAKPDPEGIPFDEDESVHREPRNISGRFFRE